MRFTVASTANGPQELPGYQLFFSLDGTTFTNVASLNPTLAGPTGVIVPNTVGVTTVVSNDIVLNGTVANGSNLILRFVDDNADQSSPDQIIGLNNVVITVPETSSLLLAANGRVRYARRNRCPPPQIEPFVGS
ncbi:MAG: hypothetical protein H7Y38_19620 [Armatimonadetes bacterium]|nr:hypothetical protein [Armatimonadota bacterium]